MLKHHEDYVVDNLFGLKEFLCLDYISIELKRIRREDFKILPSFLTRSIPKLIDELDRLSKEVQQSFENRQDNKDNYNIDIEKYRYLFQVINNQNRFVPLYKRYDNLSEEFKEFIEEHNYSKGLYFLYNENKELIYIGKSVSLGKRIVSSANQKGAYYVRVAKTSTKADMHIYEPYYVIKEQPKLNHEFIETDKITFQLKELKKSKIIAVYKK